MLKLCRVTKVNVFFLVLVYVFNFDVFELLEATLEKGLFSEREPANFFGAISRSLEGEHKSRLAINSCAWAL